MRRSLCAESRGEIFGGLNVSGMAAEGYIVVIMANRFSKLPLKSDTPERRSSER